MAEQRAAELQVTALPVAELLVTSVLVTGVVWAVSLIGSARWAALVYSLPLPITVVLTVTGLRVDGSQLLGVAALVGFFAVVTVLHDRLGWPVAVADAAGVGCYVALGWLVARFAPLPFLPTLAVVTTLWVAATALVGTGATRGRETAGAPTGRSVGPGAVARFGALPRLGVIFGAALLMVATGQLLAGLVVTFPYSGVLVALEVRARLADFTRQFLRASLGLLAFLAGFQLFQDHGRAPAVGAGWLAFAAAVLVLRLGSRPAGAGPRPG